MNRTSQTGRTRRIDPTRLLLWIAFVITIPVPLVMPVQGEMPVARILMLVAIGFLQMLVETTRGAVVQLTLLLLVQALLAMVVLWTAAWVVSRALRSLSLVARRALTLAIVVALLVTAMALEIYRDPFRVTSLHATLLTVYE